ncbi:MAG: hypothetical protein VKJ64_14535, partial [Leptolyngbyaceae bacterium]|nr:hypothetical protein [Leptolyngbyaceae bacterium]
QAIADPLVVQDDARQVVFWMQRWHDPTLFPHDRIADYFESVTPWGFKGLYGMAIALGIPPFSVNLGLPLILGLITTHYLFRITMGILPVPFTAWIACVLLNQTLWMKDDLVSATPRAFVYPVFLAFWFYWSQFSLGRGVGRSLICCALALGLLGLFYPQYVLVASGMLVIALITDILGRSKQCDHPFSQCQWIFYAVTLTVAAIVIGFYAFTASDYGPVVTWQQARAMAEFWPGGRNFFFSDNLWWFYAVGDRSGFFHVGLVRPATLSLGIFLPLLLRWRHHFPLTTFITPQIHRLSHLLIAAATLFLTAHLALFRLHLPSRYTDHSLRIILAIATALTLTLLINQGTKNEERRTRNEKRKTKNHPTRPLTHPLTHLLTATLLPLLLAYPLWVQPFPLTKYKVGRTPEIYAYLQTQPVNTVVASLAQTADNIPVFAQRSILVGYEYAIPYHLGYYDEFRRRAIALLQAQYSPDPHELIRVIQTYHINFWLLEKKAYEPNFFRKHWTQQYLSDQRLKHLPDWLDKLTNLPRRDRPILQRWQSKCTVLTEADVHLIDAQCLMKHKNGARE